MLGKQPVGAAETCRRDTYLAVSAGRLHTCAIRTDNSVECWGFNDAAQTDAPRPRILPRRLRRGEPHLRDPDRWHHPMLGNQRMGAEESARGHL